MHTFSIGNRYRSGGPNMSDVWPFRVWPRPPVFCWPSLEGSGWFGWLWKPLGGFGRLWAVLQGSGRLLMFLEVCKRMWKGLAALRPTSRSAWTSPLRTGCGLFRVALGGPPSHAQIHPREATCPPSGRNLLQNCRNHQSYTCIGMPPPKHRPIGPPRGRPSIRPRLSA